MFTIHVYPYRISVRHKVHFVFKQHEKQIKKFRTNFLLHWNLDGTLVDLSFCFVCVCLYLVRHRGFSRLQRYLRHTRVYGSAILCCRYYTTCFCQVPSFQFLNLSYFTSKDEIPAQRWTEKKMKLYMTLHKDDVYFCILLKNNLIDNVDQPFTSSFEFTIYHCAVFQNFAPPSLTSSYNTDI